MPVSSPAVEPSQARPSGSLFVYAITKAPVSLGVGVTALMLILAVSSLGCYHASLLASGLTTSEDIKGRYKGGVNPFYQVRPFLPLVQAAALHELALTLCFLSTRRALFPLRLSTPSVDLFTLLPSTITTATTISLITRLLEPIWKIIRSLTMEGRPSVTFCPTRTSIHSCLVHSPSSASKTTM